MSAQRARKLSLNSKVSGTSLRWLVFRRGFLPSEVVSDVGAVLLVLSPLDKPIPQGAFVWDSVKVVSSDDPFRVDWSAAS